jgi:hypothetical protein
MGTNAIAPASNSVTLGCGTEDFTIPTGLSFDDVVDDTATTLLALAA